MDRCALFVDAGYLLADGAMAVHGTRNRDSVAWDYAGLARLLEEVARDRTGLPLLRCYWYEATADGRRSQEQDGIADIPGVKFRSARIRPGRREGVESYVQRDLTTLARSGSLCEAVLVSGDEDMAQVVADVQDLGVRVTVVHVSVEGNWTIARALRRECDDLIEIGAGHLRPYVTLLSGGAPAAEPAAETTAPLANGHGHSAPDTERRAVTAHPGVRPEPAGGEAVFAASGAQSGAGVGGSAMEQLQAMRRSIAQQRGGDHLAPQPDAGAAPSGPIDANGFPTGPRPSHAAHNQTHPGLQNPQAPQGPPGHQGHTGHNPSLGGAHNPATGGHPSMAAATGPQPSFGAPPQPVQQPVQPAPPEHPHPPTGAHPSLAQHGPPPGPGAPGQRPPGYEHEAPPGRPGPPDPRYGPSTGENPGFGGNTGPNPTFGASTEGDPSLGALGAAQHPATATGPRLRPRVQHGPYTDAVPRADFGRPGGGAAGTLDDAVNVALREGNDFAESVARDAPALWVEAVLARRPRMPSDLEARLLQGSTLPIDFLLRDEVREALRRGFWDALGRARE
ncbi:NYN domain-containing protein [Nocardiopsis coralliicola]